MPVTVRNIDASAWEAQPESLLKLQYPERRRCYRCRNYLDGFGPFWGVYCGYRCAGRPAPSDDPRDWPRKHYGTVGHWKTMYDSPSDPRIRFDAENGRANVYFCDYCGSWHTGTLKKDR
jgi:hypothetical protein